MSSTRLARVVLKIPVKQALGSENLLVSMHVDDDNHVAVSATTREAIRAIVTVGSKFVKLVQEAGFVISPKSCVVASEARTVRSVAARFFSVPKGFWSKLQTSLELWESQQQQKGVLLC